MILEAAAPAMVSDPFSPHVRVPQVQLGHDPLMVLPVQTP
jgi:hypothetical protein